ncbi:MAG: class I SAM-dependent methyltransferase, partial [Myxococcota bacterium]
MESPTEGNRLERKTRKEDSVKQLEMVGLARGMRILDCGCGTGAVSRVMAEFVGPKGHVLGIDRSEDRLAQAKRLAEGAGRHLEFKQRSLDLPPDDSEKESFDVVWSRFVFEYLPSPEKTMANLLSYLKPGGTLVIGDLDCNGVIHYPASPALEEGLGHLVSSLEGLYDPYTGR